MEAVQVNIEDEMRQSYMDYAMSVIIGRALPDVRDGLKPVQRRVLYAMLGEGLTSKKKTSKCAGVVGEVLKRLHPHGDIPVYEALVRIAQPWNLRYPLVEGQGNFGSIDGDPPAAYRYTECRMTEIAESLLEDLDKETVDFAPNFDDSSVEPLVLPSLVPNLLINGADGIAVGMATHIPPHNLGEVIDGAISLLTNPELSLKELMAHIPGPDFPTGGIIHGQQAIRTAYAEGKAILAIRAKTEIEHLKGKSRDVVAIIVTEVPYQVNKSRLIQKIAALVNDREIEGVSRIRDESDRRGMRIVIELKRDATPEIVLNKLYKMTPMETSFGVINLAIVEGKPVVCTLIELLRHFLSHRRDVVTRRTQFELGRAQERMHLLEGFRIALLHIDEVIQLIKASETPAEAKTGLESRYALSESQAQAILELRLQKLTGMERLAIEQEHGELARRIEELRVILADSARVDRIITDELRTAKDKFGDPRRTQIIPHQGEINIEDLIEDEEMVVSISHKGYIKRTSASQYRSQRRGGKGVSGAAAREDDFIEHLFIASTLDDLLVFTSFGRLYWLKVYEIPESGRIGKGRALVNLLKLGQYENITAVLPVEEFTEGRFVVMGTRRGYIKKTDLMAFSRARQGGVIACTLAQGDSLIGVGITAGSDDILLSTKGGMSIRFTETNVRPMGRGARGVRGIRLSSDDEVVGMTIVGKLGEGVQPGVADRFDENGTLLTVCEQGYGKRTRLADYRPQGRGGKGLIDIQTDTRNGPVVRSCAVTDESGVMIVTTSGKVIRIMASGVSVIGRNTKGVKLINLEPGERAVAIATLLGGDRIDEEDGGEGGENGSNGAATPQDPITEH